MECVSNERSASSRQSKADVAPPRAAPLTAATPHGILGLQQAAGNHAVSGLMTVQRDGPPASPALAQTALTRAEVIRAAATVRLGKIAAYNGAADTAIDAYRQMRMQYAASLDLS